MRVGEFKRLAHAVANECLEPKTRFGNLILSNGKDNQEFREPQLRHVWSRQIDAMFNGSVTYSFECPTRGTHAFQNPASDAARRRGLVDLALYTEDRPVSTEPDVLVEFKIGLQATAIERDLVKLIRESTFRHVSGCAVMLIKEKASPAEVNSFCETLVDVVANASGSKYPPLEESDYSRLASTWFECLLVIRDTCAYRIGDMNMRDLIRANEFEARPLDLPA